jgi:hypothetical protein
MEKADAETGVPPIAAPQRAQKRAPSAASEPQLVQYGMILSFFAAAL